jgi:FkbM family methyltransferase
MKRPPPRVSPSGAVPAVPLTAPMVRTVRGDVMALHPLERDGAISRSIWAMRDWEPLIGAVLERLAGRGRVVYDVGANIGFFTLVAARSVGREGLVVAIEPDPDNFALLAANVAANGYRNVRLHACAVGPRAGTVTLDRSASNQGDHRTFGQRGERAGLEVAMEPLDAIAAACGRPPDVIKMDIQGFEVDALAGMATLLARRAPLAILTELAPWLLEEAGHSATAYLDALRGNGFGFQHIDHHAGRVRELEPAALAKLVAGCGAGGFADLLCIRS